MEEETIKATQIIEDQLYWTTDEIKDLKNPVINEWVSRQRYDELLKKITYKNRNIKNWISDIDN